MERLLRYILIIAAVFTILEGISQLAVMSPSPCLISLTDQEQTAHHYKKNDCPTFFAGLLVLLGRVDHFIETHDKSIVAGFTIVLAISTIGLWLATNKLWAAGERQMELIAANATQQSLDMQASNRVAHESMIASYKAVYAAEESARVLRGANRLMVEHAEIQLRAYVTVNGVMRTKNPGDLEGQGFSVLLDVQNNGQTPAYDLLQWADICIREFPLDTRLPIHCLQNPTRGILPPTTKSMVFPAFTRALTKIEENAIVANHTAIYVFGEIDYRDVFGKRHLTQFRFRCNGQGYPLGLFKPDGEGNEAT